MLFWQQSDDEGVGIDIVKKFAEELQVIYGYLYTLIGNSGVQIFLAKSVILVT
jgi:hypothetical protein